MVPGTTDMFPADKEDENEKIKSKMTEKQATDVCKKEAKTINQTYQNLLTNNGNYQGNTISASTICSIE